MSRGSVLRAVLLVAFILTAACGGGGGGDGGQGLASDRPSTSQTTPSTEETSSSDQGTTTSTNQRPTTTERTTTTTTTASTTTTRPTTTRPSTTTTAPRTTTTEHTGTTQGALPPTTTVIASPVTTPASTSQEGDTGWWWLLLLVVIVGGVIVWLFTRPKKAPIDERWRAQAEQLATDMDSVSHLLLAGIEPDGVIANDRWAGVLSRSQELRRLAANVAAAAQTPELRDAVASPADALRSLELSADAARLHVVGAPDAARADADRVGTALTSLRERVSPTAPVHD